MEDQKEQIIRPKLVWVIVVFVSVSAIWTLSSMYLVFSGQVPLNEAQKAYFDNLSMFDYGYTLLIATCNILGAIFIFLLNKYAFHLFLTALVVNILSSIWSIFATGLVEAMGSNIIGMLIGIGIAAAICMYSKNLVTKGVLT